MADAHKNFAYSTVAVAPTPAASGVTLDVAAGTGTLFPAVPFNATVWPTGVQPTAANAEIVRVTNIATDTFTVTRTQESTSARTVIVGDQIAATVTAKTLTDVEAPTALSIVGTTAPQLTVGYDGSNYTEVATASNGQPSSAITGAGEGYGWAMLHPLTIGFRATQPGDFGLGIFPGSTGFAGAEAYALSGTSQFGILAGPEFSSSCTVRGRVVNLDVVTADAAFTMPIGTALHIGTGVKGAASTITTQYGIYIDNQALGATNYAIYTNAGAVRFGGAVTCAGLLNLSNGVDTIVMNGVRHGAPEQQSGAAAGFSIFPLGAEVSYYLVISGSDVADGASTHSYVDVVVARLNDTTLTHVVLSSSTLNGSPPGRTYSLDSGNLHVVHASGTTWYVDVAVTRFSQ